MTDGQDRTLHLGKSQLDLDTGDLFDSVGSPIPLSQRSKSILAAMAASVGQDVAKEELIAAAGGEATNTDETLIQCIGEIRRAIGDQAKTLIQTVPGVGYRLSPNPPDQKRRKGNALKYLGLAVALVPIILILFGLVSGFLS